MIEEVVDSEKFSFISNTRGGRSSSEITQPINDSSAKFPKPLVSKFLMLDSSIAKD